MGIECREFRWVYYNFRGRISVRHVYRSRSILPSQSGVPSKQPPPCGLLGLLALPPPLYAIAAGYYRDGKEKGAQELGCPRSTFDARFEEVCIPAEEYHEWIMAVVLKFGLRGHGEVRFIDMLPSPRREKTVKGVEVSLLPVTSSAFPCQRSQAGLSPDDM